MTDCSPASSGPWIDINLCDQSLTTFENQAKRQRYLISSGANGSGQQNGSGCTPLGKHQIRAKIGQGEALNTVFRGRRPTGEIYQRGMRDAAPERDWILTRILWLSGCEPGFNRLGEVDTMRRYIYIHGSPDEVEMGQIGSKGCIRMRNEDLLALFDWAPIGCEVHIHE